MSEKLCEAGDYGWDDCENPAEVVAKFDGERAELCRECYEGAAYALWESWYRSAAR